MPTKKRISIAGAIAHVMNRGIDGHEIFQDDGDREFFLDSFSRGIARTGYLCYGWALMNNHYHFIVRCSEFELDRLMRPVNSEYARFYNKKYSRKGYVFGSRFRSILSQDQRYLEELIRYVHLNPLRAGICVTLEELDRYRWCGHGVLMGNATWSFQTTDAVLRRFGSTKAKAVAEYRSYLSIAGKQSDSWLIEAVRNSNVGVDRKARPECWVIGDPEFVSSVMKRQGARLALRRAVSGKWSLDGVCGYVAAGEGVAKEDLKRRCRLTAPAICRKKFVFIACRVLGFSTASVAAYLGISSPAVSCLVRKGQDLVTDDEIGKITKLTPG